MTDFDGDAELSDAVVEEPDLEEPMTYQAAGPEERPAEVDTADWLEQQHEEPVDDDAVELGEAP
jgi:hypothetical protein